MTAKLKELLRTNQLIRVFGLGQLCYPKLIEMVGRGGGFHAVWLDQEHAGLTLAQIDHAARAARAAGLDSFVRLAPTDYAAVMRPLEAGAGGIMAAQVRCVKQAEEILQWSKFAPRGQRGINGTGFDAGYGTRPLRDYLSQANAESFVAIQIEHRDALAEVEAIAALPELDVVFIGPADLCQSLGITADWEHPVLWQAIERVASAAKRHGIHWAILPPSPAAARRCVDLGCRMLSLGLDVWAFQKGLEAFEQTFLEFFAI